MMKKLTLALAAFMFYMGNAQAESITVEVAGLDIVLPFQEVNASQLYDFRAGRGFVGAETNVVKRGDGALVFGGATSTAGTVAFPFVGLNFKLPSPPFDTSDNDLLFGAWVGRDFAAAETFYGVKGSVGLF